ncbi:MAG: DUF433 domain-containing protein [Planctomycetes bacterium]|nr:DUF433 domain-containing protein [Planctomycetota bacterium]
MEIEIINRGRGPEIKGTRITVYDLMDYTEAGWRPNSIALLFGLNSAQVQCAIRYIEEHKAEVLPVYQEMLARDARGNPPEIEEKLRKSREKLQAILDAKENGKGTEKAAVRLISIFCDIDRFRGTGRLYLT